MSTQIDLYALKQELKNYSEDTINAILKNISVKVNDTIHQVKPARRTTDPTAKWEYDSKSKEGTLTFDYIVGRDGADGSSADQMGIQCVIYPTSDDQVNTKLQVQSKSIIVTSDDVKRGYFEDGTDTYNYIKYTGEIGSGEYDSTKFEIEQRKRGFVVVKMSFTNKSAITGNTSISDCVFRLNCGVDGIGTLIQRSNIEDASTSSGTGTSSGSDTTTAKLEIKTDASGAIYLAGVKGGSSNLYWSGVADNSTPYVSGSTLTSTNIKALSQIQIGSASKITSSNTIELGISNSTPKVKLDGSTGDVTATAFYESSDERLKVFRGDVDLTLDEINSIPLKYFTWKSSPDQTMQLGTSAQEIKKIVPYIVNENQFLSVDYAKLSIVALRAIRLLTDEIKELKKPWYKKIFDKIKKFF